VREALPRFGAGQRWYFSSLLRKSRIFLFDPTQTGLTGFAPGHLQWQLDLSSYGALGVTLHLTELLAMREHDVSSASQLETLVLCDAEI
jgi:hypothetical protein